MHNHKDNYTHAVTTIPSNNTTAAPENAAAPAPATEPLQDTSVDCNIYYPDYCGVGNAWMDLNCQTTCEGFATVTTAAPAAAPTIRTVAGIAIDTVAVLFIIYIYGGGYIICV